MKTTRQRRKKRERLAKQTRKRRHGGGGSDFFPKDGAGQPYDLFYANPISNWLGFSTMIQFEHPKFKVSTTANPKFGSTNRPVKIDDNYAFKFFYLKSPSNPSDKQWYVMLNIQIYKNWFSKKSSNLTIYGIKPEAIIQTNIYNKPGNNNITIMFDSRFVEQPENPNEVVIKTTELIKTEQSDSIVQYLQSETFVKEMAKEGANQVSADGMFSMFDSIWSSSSSSS